MSTKQMTHRAAVASVAAALLGVTMVGIGAQRPEARIEAGESAAAMDGGVLLVAMTLINEGQSPASGVQVTDIDVPGWTVSKPALPANLPDLAPGAEVELQMAFVRGRAGAAPHRISVRGTYQEGNRSRRLQVDDDLETPQPAEGTATAGRVTVRTQTVSGGGFPPQPPPERLEEEDHLVPLPQGRDLSSTPETPATQIRRLPPMPPIVGERRGDGLEPSEGLIPMKANDPVTFAAGGTEPISTGLTWAKNIGTIAWDPSGLSVDVKTTEREPQRLVFLTGNLYVMMSTDGGKTFTRLDPTTIFPTIPLDGLPKDEGLCCDMNAIYVPQIDRIVWQLHTRGSQIGTDPETGNPLNGYNRLRIAYASPAQVIASGGTAWTYFDMTTATFGFPKQAFFDYPDISSSNTSLHVSVVRPDMGGFFIIRVPLDDLVSGPTINIGFTDPSTAKPARLAHDVPNGAYWFNHNTTDLVKAFEWLDGSGVYSWHSVKSGWKLDEAGYTSVTPSGADWIAANTRVIRGATFTGFFTDTIDGQFAIGRRFVVAWNAPRVDGFPQPYVRTLTITKREVVNGPTVWDREAKGQVWHPDFAFHHAHLATNSNGEVGISVAAGGNVSEATPVTGFLGDSTLYAWNTSTISIARWGDYTAIRRHWPNQRLFSVSDYYLEDEGDKKFSAIHQWRLFGRAADVQ